MSGWSERPLGDIVSIAGGGTPERSNSSFFGGNIPWVTPKDMKSWDIHGTQVNLTPEGLSKSAAQLVPTDSVLIVVRSGVLKHTVPVAINRVPVAINQDMKSLQCLDEVNPRFLARFLKARSPEILKWVRATTADNFPIEMLRRLRVPLPPMPEQRRIADVLDRAEALRAKRRAALKRCDDLASALFVHLFGPRGRYRPQCDVASLGTLCRTISDGVHKTPTYVEFGVPFVTVTNMVSGVLDLKNTKFISRAEFESFAPRIRPERGDVLVSKDGTIGMPCPVETEAEFGIFVSVALLKTRTDLIDQTFLVSQIRDSVLQDQIRAGSKGIAIRHLHLEDFVRLRIVLPPLDLQRTFASHVAAIEKVRALHRASLAKLDELFASLQHRAFRGEL